MPHTIAVDLDEISNCLTEDELISLGDLGLTSLGQRNQHQSNVPFVLGAGHIRHVRRRRALACLERESNIG